jgi:hypothetical protein
MEDDKKSSMSDKDRRMAGRFEGFGFKKEDDDEKKGKKSVKIPRRGLFSSKEAESPVKSEALDRVVEKKGLFSGLLKDKEVEIEAVVPEIKKPTTESVDDFQEVVYDRIKDVEQELELPLPDNQAEAVVADVDFLEEVSERLEEGLPPVEAIDDALETIYVPPEADATESDLSTPENFEPATEIPLVDSTPEIVDVYAREATETGASATETETLTASERIVPMNEIYYRDRGSGDVIIGGAMGYLLGKNRGRHLAESRLEPEIDKKDKQIEEFKQKLEKTEAQIREEVQDRSEIKAVTLAETKTPKLSSEKIEKQIEKLPVETIKAEKEVIEEQEKQFEEILETEQPKQEKIVEKPDVITELFDKTKDVRSLTMPELLEVAENIGFEKSNLKELYERHRIDAVNLRRVIIEFMNGGTRYEKILRGSLEAVEMQRELRGEIKHDDGFGTNVVKDDSSRSDLNSSDNTTSSETNSNGIINSTSVTNNNVRINNENIERHSVISGEIAVALGIITGVAIALLFMIFG